MENHTAPRSSQVKLFGSMASRMAKSESSCRDDETHLVSRDNFEIPLGYDTFLLPTEDSYVLYAPRFRTAFELTTAQTLLLTTRLNDPAILAQHLSALLGENVLQDAKSSSEESYRPTTAALMLTSACQLRCAYCYAKAGETPSENLDVAVGKKAIDFVASNATERGVPLFSIHVHGAGEPTLRGHAIRTLLSYARSVAHLRGLGVRTLMSTNFSVDESDAVYYAQNIDSLHVSCDGPLEVMKANRAAVNGDDRAHELTYRALAAVARANLMHKVVARCTVTSQSQHRLAEIVDFFSELGVRAIYMVGVSSLGRGATQGGVQPSPFVQHYRAAKVRARQLGIALFYPGVDIHRLRSDGYGCGINGTNFVVLPDGEVSLCYEAVVRQTPQRDYFSIGRIGLNEMAIDTNKVRKVAEATHVTRRSACSTCFCRLTCAGQCAARNFSDGKEVRDAEMTLACDITRTLTMDEIGNELL